jgi:hypothetical protein
MDIPMHDIESLVRFVAARQCNSLKETCVSIARHIWGGHLVSFGYVVAPSAFIFACPVRVANAVFCARIIFAFPLDISHFSLRIFG